MVHAEGGVDVAVVAFDDFGGVVAQVGVEEKLAVGVGDIWRLTQAVSFWERGPKYFSIWDFRHFIRGEKKYQQETRILIH